MAGLRTLLKRRDQLMDKIFDLAESNYDEQQSNLAARDSDSPPSRASKERSKKLAILRKREDALDAEIKRKKENEAKKKKPASKVESRISGGAGGRMMMPQEYSKRSLYKPKTN